MNIKFCGISWLRKREKQQSSGQKWICWKIWSEKVRKKRESWLMKSKWFWSSTSMRLRRKRFYKRMRWNCEFLMRRYKKPTIPYNNNTKKWNCNFNSKPIHKHKPLKNYTKKLQTLSSLHLSSSKSLGL